MMSLQFRNATTNVIHVGKSSHYDPARCKTAGLRSLAIPIYVLHRFDPTPCTLLLWTNWRARRREYARAYASVGERRERERERERGGEKTFSRPACKTSTTGTNNGHETMPHVSVICHVARFCLRFLIYPFRRRGLTSAS
jgi:hypothetical protein